MYQNITALLLVVVSGIIHMIWNSRYKVAHFPNRLFAGARFLNLIYLLPICIYFFEPISSKAWVYMITSGIIHYFYFYFLILMYSNEDFSKVYPLSRGLGNLLTPILGVTLINESLGIIPLIGILANVIGLFLINFRNLKTLTNQEKKGVRISASKGVIYSILTGITITMYSYVDKLGVDELNPVQYFYIYMAITFIIYNFHFFLKKENVYSDLFKKKNLFEYSFVGLSDALSYLLILFTLTFTNLSYVAPMRNSGIVTSSLFGLIYLNEKFYKSRLIGSILIFVGIIIITIGIK
tara:strand:- start:17111 stop:17995 length:885 start_codon:yes stop_codon:yes gene_type:complete